MYTRLAAATADCQQPSPSSGKHWRWVPCSHGLKSSPLHSPRRAPIELLPWVAMHITKAVSEVSRLVNVTEAAYFSIERPYLYLPRRADFEVLRLQSSLQCTRERISGSQHLRSKAHTKGAPLIEALDPAVKRSPWHDCLRLKCKLDCLHGQARQLLRKDCMKCSPSRCDRCDFPCGCCSGEFGGVLRHWRCH